MMMAMLAYLACSTLACHTPRAVSGSDAEDVYLLVYTLAGCDSLSE